MKKAPVPLRRLGSNSLRVHSHTLLVSVYFLSVSGLGVSSVVVGGHRSDFGAADLIGHISILTDWVYLSIYLPLAAQSPVKANQPSIPLVKSTVILLSASARLQ